MFGKRAVAAMGIMLAAQAAVAQGDNRVPQSAHMIELSGPRFGVTMLTPAMVDSLKSHNIKVSQVISQFGWQFEKQFLGEPNGVAAVSEWVVLVGGLDQGVFLPSATWLVGIRGPSGMEFGLGPNASLAGFALAVAGGATIRSGALNIPINVAAVPSREGTRFSILTGFTMSR